MEPDLPLIRDLGGGMARGLVPAAGSSEGGQTSGRLALKPPRGRTERRAGCLPSALSMRRGHPPSQTSGDGHRPSNDVRPSLSRPDRPPDEPAHGPAVAVSPERDEDQRPVAATWPAANRLRIARTPRMMRPSAIRRRDLGPIGAGVPANKCAVRSPIRITPSIRTPTEPGPVRGVRANDLGVVSTQTFGASVFAALVRANLRMPPRGTLLPNTITLTSGTLSIEIEGDWILVR